MYLIPEAVTVIKCSVGTWKNVPHKHVTSFWMIFADFPGNWWGSVAYTSSLVCLFSVCVLGRLISIHASPYWSQGTAANHQQGMKYLLQAAESAHGHRAAMIEIARALDSGEAGELCTDVKEEGSGSDSRYYMRCTLIGKLICTMWHVYYLWCHALFRAHWQWNMGFLNHLEDTSCSHVKLVNVL